MIAKRFLLAACLLFLVSCGGTDFVPNPGPFNGNFKDSTTQLGSFTFTVTDGLIGGTGTVIHNSQQISVSISAVISGSTITGQVSNGSVGSGDFVGSFSSDKGAYGTFQFTGTVDQQTTSGTWNAVVN